jgi:WD40 repeat protein
VISGGYDQTVRLWDARAGNLVHRLHGTMRWVSAVRFSPDGRWLASSGLDGPVRLWEAGSGRRLHALRGHHGAIRAMAFAPHNDLLAGGCDDYQVYLWDMARGELPRVLRGHIDMVRSVAFNPENDILATGSYDRTVRLWNTTTGHLLRVIADAHALSEFALGWSADGELLAYPCTDNTVELLHHPSGQVWERLSLGREHPLAVAHSPKGDLLACGTQEGAVWLWDVSPASGGGAAALHFRVQPGNRKILRLQWSPDNRWLAAYDEGSTVHLIDAARGAVVYAVPGVSTIYNLAFGQGGNLLITGEAACRAAVRDAATGTVRRLFTGHVGEITALDASTQGDLLASSSADGVVCLWHPEAGECLATLEPEGPYAGMEIARAIGISAAQRATLLALGAVDRNQGMLTPH